MIKLTIQFLLIFLLTNCSINSKSKFWKEGERKKIETSSEIELFKEKKSFSEEYNTNIKVSLNNNYQRNSFVNNNKNNIKILNYDGKLNLEETFKFKKIDNFNLFQADIHITKYSNLIIFDGRGSIIKLDENLKLIWKKNIYKKKEIKNNLLLNFSSSNNSLIVTDNISNIYSIDLKTGNLNWKKNSKSSFNSDTKIKEDRIYVVDYDNILHCLSIKNGNIIWKYISDNTLIKSTKKVSLILDDKKVVFINSLGDVNALDLINGNLIWQTPTQKSSVVEDSFSIKYSKIVLENNSIFFSNNKNQFFSINSKNGNLNWIKNINSVVTPIILDKIIFTISNDGYLIVLDTLKGEIIRSTNINSEINFKNNLFFNGFIIAKKKIYVTLNDGKILVVDILNGKPIVTKNLKRSNISKPIVLNKYMFILSKNSIRKYN